MTIHPSITTTRVLALLTENKRGLCVRCGEDVEGVEPDAVQPCLCLRCGEASVCSPKQILGYWRAEKRITTVTVTAPWQAPHAGVGVHVDWWSALLVLGVLWLLGVLLGLWLG